MPSFETERVQQFPASVLFDYLAGCSSYDVWEHEIVELTLGRDLVEEMEYAIIRARRLPRDRRTVRFEEFYQPVRQNVVLLLPLFSNQRLKGLPEKRLITTIGGAQYLDQ